MHVRGLRISIVIGFILANTIIIPNMISSPAKALSYQLPVLVQFDNASVVADVRPGSNCTAHLTGIVIFGIPLNSGASIMNTTLVPECD